MSKGYSENTSFVHDVSPEGDVTRLHIEGDTMTVQQTYDAEKHLRYTQMLREAQEGKRWGEGRIVGHIPGPELGRILKLPREQQQAAILQFLRANNQFVAFERYLKR